MQHNHPIDAEVLIVIAAGVLAGGWVINKAIDRFTNWFVNWYHRMIRTRAVACIVVGLAIAAAPFVFHSHDRTGTWICVGFGLAIAGGAVAARHQDKIDQWWSQ